MPLRLLPFYIALLSLPIFSVAQQTTFVQVQPERLFIYGDFVYPANFRGMRQFMADLPALDPEVNRRMQIEWQRIRQRHTTGQILLWGSVGIGGAFVLAAGIPKEQVRTIQGPIRPITVTESDYSAAARRLTIGSLIMLGGGLAGWLVLRNSNDPLLFMNTFNKLSPSQKLRLSTETSVGPGLGLYYSLE